MQVKRSEYDVIIIGANAAGLGCANILKNTNLSVLLIEKNRTIGKKLCTGILVPQIESAYFPQDKIYSVSSYKIRYFENKDYVTLPGSMRFISRTDLGAHLQKRCANAENIELVTGTPVKKIEKGYVYLENSRIRYTYLVGADGSNSITRKYLGLGVKKLMSFVYESSQKVQGTIIDIQKGYKHGYAWITQLPDKSQAGYVYDPKRLSHRTAGEIFHAYLKEHSYDFENSRLQSAPISYGYKGFQFDNIFLTGDAAGLARKRDGEGIYEALVSGEEAGKKILDPDYNLPLLHSILVQKKNSERIFNLLCAFPFLYTISMRRVLKKLQQFG